MAEILNNKPKQEYGLTKGEGLIHDLSELLKEQYDQVFGVTDWAIINTKNHRLITWTYASDTFLVELLKCSRKSNENQEDITVETFVADEYEYRNEISMQNRFVNKRIIEKKTFPVEDIRVSDLMEIYLKMRDVGVNQAHMSLLSSFLPSLKDLDIQVLIKKE